MATRYLMRIDLSRELPWDSGSNSRLSLFSSSLYGRQGVSWSPRDISIKLAVRALLHQFSGVMFERGPVVSVP